MLSEKETGNIETRLLKPIHWIAVLVALAINVAWANWLSPIPWGNDFGGLGLTTVLMDRHGWKYCISDNWGFAHTSLHYLLTKLTGDLWLSSRLICTLSLVLLVYASEKVMRSTFDVRSASVRTFFLLALAVSPLVTSLSLCYYLETVAITLFMAALALLWVRQPMMHIVGGLVATSGYWFRFHFLVFGAFYCILVYFSRYTDRPKQRAFWSAAGFGLAVLVSSTVCKLSTGSWSTSNQKAVLAVWTPDYSWDFDYQVGLDSLGYKEIWSHIDWHLMLHTFAKNWISNPQFVVTVCLLLFVFFLVMQRKSSNTSWSFKKVLQVFQNPLVSIMTFVLLAIAPFMVIRGEMNYRLSADFLIFSVPWLAGVYAHCTRKMETPLAPPACLGNDRGAKWIRLIARCLVIMAVVSLTVISAPRTYSYYYNCYKSWQSKDLEIDTVIPEKVRGRTPDLVWCPSYHPNKADRYWLWRPTVYYGWPVRSAAFRQLLGFIRLDDVPALARQGKIRYIIFEKALPAPAWDMIPVEVVKQKHILDQVVIMELNNE